MTQWSREKAVDWYGAQPFLIGCNFLPSSASNQLEMFQADSFDVATLRREIGWAADLGFNCLRIYLHDLLIEEDGFFTRLDTVLDICAANAMRPILVLFDDCHYGYPKRGPQKPPIKGIHNSRWKQSPGHHIVRQIHDGTGDAELARLENYVSAVLQHYGQDERILMWDIYNEPGQFGIGETSKELLLAVWQWAQALRPAQPLTACIDGAIGDAHHQINRQNSDVLTFHMYEADQLEACIEALKGEERPIICTEYMARGHGTSFAFSLPIFKKHDVGCINWGLVAGRSQTHFDWETILQRAERVKAEQFLTADEALPEPDLWHHDILRMDGSAYIAEETELLKAFAKSMNG